MRKSSLNWVLLVVLLLSLLNLGLGWLMPDVRFTAGGGLGICYVVVRYLVWAGNRRRQKDQRQSTDFARAKPVATVAQRDLADPSDTEGLVEQMMAQGRFPLLLRAQIAETLSRTHFGRALQALEESMGLVPDGEVVLGQIDDALDDGRLDDEEIVAARGRVVRVEPFFVDRYPVTNRQYYEFVADGGYEQMSLWEKTIWPAVLDLVDRTGMPGPRYWREGCFAAGEENHPVVGVSWYEAGAYSRWVGKRLPSDAEWVKVGSWPVTLSATSRSQRKYPWGETMDRKRANLWGSGPEEIVAVDQFAEGVSVGGVYQLIGNVWEWTSGGFHSINHPDSELILPMPMKGIRGGAYDTYFENQATCQFQSGENPLARRHNIGFRCAVGVCDLSLARAPEQEPQQTDAPPDAPAQPDVAAQSDTEPEEVHA